MACKHLLKAELLLATELKWDQYIIFFLTCKEKNLLLNPLSITI